MQWTIEVKMNFIIYKLQWNGWFGHFTYNRNHNSRRLSVLFRIVLIIIDIINSDDVIIVNVVVVIVVVVSIVLAKHRTEHSGNSDDT